MPLNSLSQGTLRVPLILTYHITISNIEKIIGVRNNWGQNNWGQRIIGVRVKLNATQLPKPGYATRTFNPNVSYHYLKYRVCRAKINLVHYAVRAAYPFAGWRVVAGIESIYLTSREQRSLGWYCSNPTFIAPVYWVAKKHIPTHTRGHTHKGSGLAIMQPVS
jgi:hypothetical protein